MDPGGSIAIDLAWDGASICGVRVAPRHAIEAARLLQGKPAQQAIGMIPLLFSLCGKAQGVAGVMALEAAQGITPSTETAQWRQRLVLCEVMQESLWRFLLDLPKQAGMPPMLADYAALRHQLAEVTQPMLAGGNWNMPGGQINGPDAAAWDKLLAYLGRFLGSVVLGMPCDEWRQLSSLPDIEAWLTTAQTPLAASLRHLWQGVGRWGGGGTALLPLLGPDEMVRSLLPELERDREFTVLPHWHGAPAETGALARMAQHPVLSELMRQECASIVTRLLARLFEAVELIGMLRQAGESRSWLASARLRPGVGAAWVQTSRGLLVHWLRLEGEQVADYRSVAPTEWNFHPHGAYAAGLTAQAADSEEAARRAAELLLLALDPCVAYKLSISHA